MKKVLFTATVDSHILHFHIPYLKWFKEHGYEVHVATNGSEIIPYCDVKHIIPFERSPFKINNLKAITTLKKIILKEKFDVIHCHTPVGGFLTRLAAKETRKNGTKVIYTAHGFHFYKGAPLLNWIIYYPIEKIASRWTDCLITITEEDYVFAKKKMKAKRIEHINGVGMNTERLKRELSENEKIEIRKELQIGEKDIVFTYVAELNKNKNQILLINTINDLKKEYSNVKLLLVGEGVLQNEYNNVIKEKKLENNVILLGKREDINEILSITDIYLASSIREGLPVNIMEAMYKGLPIIATDNRGHRELVKNNENGFIVCNEDEMMKSITNIIKNGLKDKLGNVGKDRSEKYKIENIIENMIRIYGE